MRLLEIHRAVTELIVTHKPEQIGVERLFFNRNVQTAFAVGQARGVVLLAAAEHGLPVFEYGPHEVKLAVTGYGRADKDQVQTHGPDGARHVDAAQAGRRGRRAGRRDLPRPRPAPGRLTGRP